MNPQTHAAIFRLHPADVCHYQYLNRCHNTQFPSSLQSFQPPRPVRVDPIHNRVRLQALHKFFTKLQHLLHPTRQRRLLIPHVNIRKYHMKHLVPRDTRVPAMKRYQFHPLLEVSALRCNFPLSGLICSFWAAISAHAERSSAIKSRVNCEQALVSNGTTKAS